ncbi:MAG: hypothetical protein U0V75_15630 [Ferruginibacter sp.]
MKKIYSLSLGTLLVLFTAAQDAALIKQDLQKLNTEILKSVAKISRDEIKLINEESYIISYTIKDSLLAGIEAFGRKEGILKNSVNTLLQLVKVLYRASTCINKQGLILIRIKNCSGRIESRSNAKLSYDNDYKTFDAWLTAYGLTEKITICLSADPPIRQSFSEAIFLTCTLKAQ